MAGPLQGLRVVELAGIGPGPHAAMILGDLGAEVIKVEHPERGDDTRDWGMRIGSTETAYFNSVNRNKRSVCLDLKTPEGQEIARELVRKSDVVIQNFKFGGIAKMGLDYDTLAAELEDAAIHWGMDALIEVHDAEELDRALRLRSPLIGINNRNLKTFEVDLETTLKLAPGIPADREVVCESGLFMAADLCRMMEAGVRRFLIGESLMRQAGGTPATRQIPGAA